MNYKGLYDISYRTRNGKAVIYLFIRDESGKKVIEKVEGFIPYLYIDKDALEKYRAPDIIHINPEEYKTVFGKTVKKCFVRAPNKIYYVRKCYNDKSVHEADILFDLRYAVDKVSEIEGTKYKILSIDIETDCSEGFPQDFNPVEPITCISSHSSYTDKIITFVWRKDLEKKHVGDVYYYNDEVEMLSDFLKYWQSVNPDIVTAWNVGFDINYIVARLKRLKIDYSKLSCVKDRFDILRDRRGDRMTTNDTVRKLPKGQMEVLGTVVFDLLSAYKKMHFGQLDSYSLNNVATDELGEEKEKVYNTGKVWREDIEQLISYNRKDVDLIVRIDKKCKLISIFNDIKDFAGVRNINDCFSASRIHETRIMKKYKDKYVFPTKPPFKEKSDATRIQGAFVKEPTAGLYKNVICIDAKSLYPNIIYTFNLSTEMVDKDGVEINGIKIKQEPKGIMPNMIKELLNLKEDMKKKVVGTGQNLSDKMFAIKTFINSFYGINALTSFRLYNKQIAENITFLGREMITMCSKAVEEEYGYKVVYNDTDSLFIEISEGVDSVKEGKKIQKFLDDIIQKFVHEKYHVVDPTLHMEFETVFKRLMLQRKKRYAGLITWEDGKQKDKIKIAGMASRRSDTPQISKDMQKKLFDMVLRDEPKENCIQYVTGLIDDILNNKLTKEEISLPVKFRNKGRRV